MEPQSNRESVRVAESSRADAPRPLASSDYDVAASVPDARGGFPTPTAVERHQSVRTVEPHAVAGGLLAVAMLAWGGVVLARTELDDTWRDPVVDVAGIDATAAAGAIVAAIGLALLIAALARQRGAILLVVVLAGVAALITAIEPGIADSGLGGDARLGIAVAIGCGIVALVTLAVPTVNRRTAIVEQW